MVWGFNHELPQGDGLGCNWCSQGCFSHSFGRRRGAGWVFRLHISAPWLDTVGCEQICHPWVTGSCSKLFAKGERGPAEHVVLSHSPAELRALETPLSKTKADVNRKPASPGESHRLCAKPGNDMSVQSTRKARASPALPAQQPGATIWRFPTLGCSRVSMSLTLPQGQEPHPTGDIICCWGGGTEPGDGGKMLSQDPEHPWEQENPELCSKTSVRHLPPWWYGSGFLLSASLMSTEPHAPSFLGKLRRRQPQITPNSRTNTKV